MPDGTPLYSMPDQNEKPRQYQAAVRLFNNAKILSIIAEQETRPLTREEAKRMVSCGIIETIALAYFDLGVLGVDLRSLLYSLFP